MQNRRIPHPILIKEFGLQVINFAHEECCYPECLDLCNHSGSERKVRTDKCNVPVVQKCLMRWNEKAIQSVGGGSITGDLCAGIVNGRSSCSLWWRSSWAVFQGWDVGKDIVSYFAKQILFSSFTLPWKQHAHSLVRQETYGRPSRPPCAADECVDTYILAV